MSKKVAEFETEKPSCHVSDCNTAEKGKCTVWKNKDCAICRKRKNALGIPTH